MTNILVKFDDSSKCFVLFTQLYRKAASCTMLNGSVLRYNLLSLNKILKNIINRSMIKLNHSARQIIIFVHVIISLASNISVKGKTFCFK